MAILSRGDLGGGVDAVAMAEGNPEPVSAALKAELEALAARPENMIDTSDIPEVMDWRAAERGRFYRPTRLYPAQLGLSRS